MDITAGLDLVNRDFYKIEEPYDRVKVDFTLKGSDTEQSNATFLFVVQDWQIPELGQGKNSENAEIKVTVGDVTTSYEIEFDRIFW